MVLGPRTAQLMARALAAEGGSSLGAELVAALRPFAAFALVAVLMGRAIGPSVAGSGVGLSDVVNGLERGGAILSQAYALFGTLALLLLAYVVAFGRWPLAVRVVSTSLAGLVALLVLGAAPSPASSLSRLLLGLAAALLALIAAWSVRRAPLARGLALALGAVGLAAALRLLAVTLAAICTTSPVALTHALFTALSLSAGVLDALAVGIAALALSPTPTAGRLLRPATALAVIAAFILTRYALVGTDAQGFAAVLVRRSVARLVIEPGFGFTTLGVFVTSLAVVVAATALVRSATMPALSAIFSMLVLVRGTPDVPLAGLTLALAALGALVAAHDERALWAELAKRRSPPRPGIV